MDDERLEWELRRLPGVLGCSLEGDTVTLLLDPHASAVEVEAAANALLLDAGDSRPPLVLGGTRPVVAAGRRRFDVVPVVKSAGPSLVAVGAAALVATLVASPAAFWRDLIQDPSPEAGSGMAVTAPPSTRARSTIGAGLNDAMIDVADDAMAETPAAHAHRRLVLLIPEQPSPLSAGPAPLDEPAPELQERVAAAAHRAPSAARGRSQTAPNAAARARTRAEGLDIASMVAQARREASASIGLGR